MITLVNSDDIARKDAVIAALRNAGCMTIIEAALDEATRPGDIWPQNQDGNWPNPAFLLAMINLIKRDPTHTRHALWEFLYSTHSVQLVSVDVCFPK